MGANGQLNETAWDKRVLGLIDSLAQDLRFGARTLAKNPAFSGGVILTLAIGIAGVTAMFSIAYGVLLKPLPYPEPDRLVAIWRDDELSFGRGWAAVGDVRNLRETTRAFERIGTYRERTHVLKDGESIEAEYIRSVSVDPEILSVLGTGLAPILGRVFVAEEYQPEPFAAILTHRLWQRRFGSDSGVLGRTLRLSDGPDNETVVTVVGVMPEDFRFNAIGVGGDAAYAWEPDLLLPLAPTAAQMQAERRPYYGQLVGRLKGGVPIEAAQAELDLFAAALRQEHPEIGDRRYRAVPLKAEVTAWARSTVLLYFGTVAFVLLIAVANVANLQLARAASREAEIAVRVSIGSTRLRLVRMFVTESVILALAGALAGVVLAKIALGWLIAGFPAWPRLEESGIDGHVVAFAAALAIATGVLFGLAPAFHAFRASINRALHAGARGHTEGGRRLRFRNMLIAAEVALAVVLLAAAGLVGQSFRNLVNQDPGMNPENLLYANVRRDRPSSNRSEGVQFYEEIVGRLEQFPAVASASYRFSTPFGAGRVTVEETMETRAEPFAMYTAIAADFFQTLGVPIERGRLFDESTPGEVLITERMARQFWPSGNPVGRRFVVGPEPGSDNPWLTVVGVIPNFKTAPTMPIEGGGIMVLAAFFGLCEHAPGSAGSAASGCNDASLVVRTRRDPAEVIELVRSEIAAMDPEATLTQLQTSDQMYDSAVAAPQFRAALFGIFAGVALLLTFVGVYGVASYAAARRVREVGVRMALGATRADVMRMLLKQALVPVLLGTAIGLMGATAATRLLTAYLFQVEPGDPWIFMTILLTVAVTACMASFMPTFRASATDPTAALRSE